MIEVSVVSPVYRSAGLVKPFVDRVIAALQHLDVSYEIILVDDGSPDASWSAIEGVCAANTNIKGIMLSRNFGQHYAVTAGLDVCSGKWVVVMDSDLQDRPEEIVRLYEKAQEGFEVVLCRRNVRNDSWLKIVGSRWFHKFLSFITDKKIDPTVANFGIYEGKVIAAFVRMREAIRSFRLMILWLGFKTTTIDVQHGAREEGKSGYTFKKLMKLGLDAILSYSDKPLVIVAVTGVLISFCTLLASIVTLIRYFNHSITVQGYTSLLLSIWFLSGLIIATLGIVGLYVGKIFQGVKQRPLYVSSKTININHDKANDDKQTL